MPEEKSRRDRQRDAATFRIHDGANQNRSLWKDRTASVQPAIAAAEWHIDSQQSVGGGVTVSCLVLCVI